MNTRQRRECQREGGFTLVEMMISAGLISLASILIITLLTSATGIMRDIEVRSRSDRQSQTIASTLESDIRSAASVDNIVPVIGVAGANELTIYRKTTATGVPTRHHYYLVADKLLMGVLTATGTDPNWTFNGTERATQVGQYVRNNTTDVMFKYYDEDGNQLTAPTTITDRAAIRKVGVNIICDVDTAKAPPAYTTTLEVNVRNQR